METNNNNVPIPVSENPQPCCSHSIPQSQPSPSPSSSSRSQNASSSSSSSRAKELLPSFPTLSWNSSNSVLVDKMLTGGKLGVMLLTDLNLEAPMVSIRETFCKLYEEPEFVNGQLNKLHPIRGVFKHNGYLDKRNIDQKAVLDLSPSQIEEIQQQNLGLGPGFPLHVLPFYNRVKSEIIPRLKYLSSYVLTGGIGWGQQPLTPAADYVMKLHSEDNIKLRLVDFYPIHKTKKRCGEHRDFTTFTLIFQDKLLGGLEIFTDDKKWIPVPAEAEAVLMWGWSAFILSNSRIKAPCHRVVPLRSNQYQKVDRRNEAVFYFAPDWNALLHPAIVFPKETLKFNVDAVKNLTVRDFKSLFEMKWHKREGTITEQEKDLLTAIRLDKRKIDGNTQDDDILDYLMGIRSIHP